MHMPNERYICIWTNRRRLEDGTTEPYEVNITHASYDKARDTYLTLVAEGDVNPIWLIDLHTTEVIRNKK